MKHPATYLAALAALLLALALPAASFAQAGSGVDEYSEGVPGSGGENHGGSNGGGNGNSLPSSTQSDLSGAGSDGAALSSVAQATAPDSDALNDATSGDKASGGSDKGANADQGDGKGGLNGVLNAAAEGTGLSAIADAAGGSSDGMGIALPLLLLTAVMLAVLFVVSRARRS